MSILPRRVGEDKWVIEDPDRHLVRFQIQGDRFIAPYIAYRMLSEFATYMARTLQRMNMPRPSTIEIGRLLVWSDPSRSLTDPLNNLREIRHIEDVAMVDQLIDGIARNLGGVPLKRSFEIRPEVAMAFSPDASPAARLYNARLERKHPTFRVATIEYERRRGEHRSPKRGGFL